MSRRTPTCEVDERSCGTASRCGCEVGAEACVEVIGERLDRANNTTRQLESKEVVEYVAERWSLS